MVSNVAEKSRQINTEKCSLDLMTRRLRVTLMGTVSLR